MFTLGLAIGILLGGGWVMFLVRRDLKNLRKR
jgi:hypothetical protein